MRSKLMAAMPAPRNSATVAATISCGWMRLINFCTWGANVCTPRLTRDTPAAANWAASPGRHARGSSSMAISASAAMSNASRSAAMTRASTGAASALGLPPPKFTATTRPFISPATVATSFSSAFS